MTNFNVTCNSVKKLDRDDERRLQFCPPHLNTIVKMPQGTVACMHKLRK